MIGEKRHPSKRYTRTTPLGPRTHDIVSATTFQRQIGSWLYVVSDEAHVVHVEAHGRPCATMLKTVDYERLVGMAYGEDHDE